MTKVETELAELRGAFSLEFVLFSNKREAIKSFALYAELDDEEIGLWFDSADNLSFFDNYGKVTTFEEARLNADKYMAQKGIKSFDNKQECQQPPPVLTYQETAYREHITAALNIMDSIIYPTDDKWEELINAQSPIQTKNVGPHAQLSGFDELRSTGEVSETAFRGTADKADRLVAQLEIADSGPKTISQQIKESQSRHEAGNSQLTKSSAAVRQGISNDAIDNEISNNSPPTLENGVDDICKVCQSLNCTELICFIQVKTLNRSGGVNATTN